MATTYKFGYEYLVKANNVFDACKKLLPKLKKDFGDGEVKLAMMYELKYIYNPNYEENSMAYYHKPGFIVNFMTRDGIYMYEFHIAEFEDSDVVSLNS